jgi:hypothetical protein
MVEIQKMTVVMNTDQVVVVVVEIKNRCNATVAITNPGIAGQTNNGGTGAINHGAQNGVIISQHSMHLIYHNTSN